MRYSKLLFLILAFSFVWTIDAIGQPCGGIFPPCGPPAPVPISGIEILIGIGAIFGVKKLFFNRKKENA